MIFFVRGEQMLKFLHTGDEREKQRTVETESIKIMFKDRTTDLWHVKTLHSVTSENVDV